MLSQLGSWPGRQYKSKVSSKVWLQSHGLPHTTRINAASDRNTAPRSTSHVSKMKVKKQRISLRRTIEVTEKSVFSLMFLRNTTLLRSNKQKLQLKTLRKFAEFQNGFFNLALTNNLRLQSDFVAKRPRANEILFPFELHQTLFSAKTFEKFEEAVAKLEEETQHDSSSLVEIDNKLLEVKRMKGLDVSRSLSFVLRISNFHRLHAITSGGGFDDQIDVTAQIIMLEQYPEVEGKDGTNIISSFTVTAQDMSSLLSSNNFLTFGNTAHDENTEEGESPGLQQGPAEKTVLVYGDGEEGEQVPE